MRILPLRILPLLAGAAALHAAVIQGTVVEAQSGRPLSRALVVATPVAGTGGVTKSARTNSYGVFSLEGLPGGSYLVSASRRAFAPTQYGQKQYKSAGLPIVLEEPQKMQIEIRLPRLAAITGKVLDENDVGMPDYDVIVYRNTRPPVMVNRLTTDDRGVYRFGGLEPGLYLIRTASKVLDEDSYLPTFYRDVFAVDQARTVDAILDQQAEEINVRPAPGRLFQVAGTAVVPSMPLPITVTLSSDMGKESVEADGRGRFQFNPQSPGKYELTIAAPATRTSPQYAGYLPFDLERDSPELRITGIQLPNVSMSFADTKGSRVDMTQVHVMARRKELSGPGPAADFTKTQLAPGRWEFAIAPNPVYYCVSFLTRNTPVSGQVAGRADGWNETVLANGENQQIQFVLSASPATIHGVVTLAGQPVPGVPVFLEPYDLDLAQRLAPVRAARTDAQGQYRFTGLAPGQYRLLGTFEYQAPGPEELEGARGVLVKVEENKDLPQDLTLYVAR